MSICVCMYVCMGIKRIVCCRDKAKKNVIIPEFGFLVLVIDDESSSTSKSVCQIGIQ